MEENSKVSIVVLSFDKYKDTWDPFFKLLEKNWIEMKFDVYLVTNFEEYNNYKKLKIIKTGKEISWKNRTIKALETVETDYVLLLLEDYFIKEKIHLDDLENIFKNIIKNKYKYTRLVNNPFNILDIFKSKKKLYSINKNEEYGVNLQPSVWNREYLLSILKLMEGTTAWEFEKHFLDKVNLYSSEKLKDHVKTSFNFLKVKNGILRGKWFWSTKFFLNKHFKNEKVLLKNRERLTLYQELYYLCRVFIRVIIPKKIKNVIKKGR